MKYLYINKGQGFYSLSGNEDSLISIDNIDKNDLLTLLNLIVESTEEKTFEMDEYNSDELKNPAHKIIYKNIYEKFDALLKKRISFVDETCNLYRTAINKYSKELEDLEE